MKSESEKYVFTVRARNRQTGQERVFKYTCIADSYKSAMVKVVNMVKVDPRLDFVRAELKERKNV